MLNNLRNFFKRTRCVKTGDVIAAEAYQTIGYLATELGFWKEPTTDENKELHDKIDRALDYFSDMSHCSQKKKWKEPFIL